MHMWRPLACPADQIGSLIDLVAWFPHAFTLCAPLVYNAGDEAQVKLLLASHKLPDLATLPRAFWPCVRFAACEESELITLVEAGVAVPLADLDLHKLSWETQQLLIE